MIMSTSKAAGKTAWAGFRGKVLRSPVLVVALAGDEAVDGCGQQVHFGSEAVHGHSKGILIKAITADC